MGTADKQVVKKYLVMRSRCYRKIILCYSDNNLTVCKMNSGVKEKKFERFLLLEKPF